MDNLNFESLIEKYRSGNITENEKQLIAEEILNDQEKLECAINGALLSGNFTLAIILMYS